MSNHSSPTSEGQPPSGIGKIDRRFSKAKRLAARLGVHPKTIFRWSVAYPDRIHRFKVNERVVLFDEDEVSAFLEASKIAS